MSYCTQDNLASQPYSEEITQLLDRNGDGSEDTGRLTLAISVADTMIDGYLVGRYSTPLAAPIPSLVMQIACDIVRYMLWGAGVPEEATTRYKDAIARLKDIAAGTLSLTSAGSEIAPTSALAVAYTERTRMFDDDTLVDFMGA